MNASRNTGITLFLAVLVLLSLIPLFRLTADWFAYVQLLPSDVQIAYRSYDWIHWQEKEGTIVATYVFPRGSAAKVGVKEGDIFYQLAYRQFFSVEDLRRAIDRIAPGSKQVLEVVRGHQIREFPILFTQYPTFLYPLSKGLWSASLWGFGLAFFLHVFALLVVLPLSRRSWEVRFALALIVSSGIWVSGQLLRILWLTLLGPPVALHSAEAILFNGLTVVGLLGWLLFPAILLHRVMREVRGKLSLVLIGVLYFPAGILGTLALFNVSGKISGPFTLDALIAPVLFYTSTYVAAALGMHLLYRKRLKTTSTFPWSEVGSMLIFLVALAASLMVLGIVPLPGVITEVTAGWFIVALQLLSVAPVGLLSYATLVHGKTDWMLNRAMGYLAVLGSFFFFFTGGMVLMRPYVEHFSWPIEVVSGLYALVVLILMERAGHYLQPVVRKFFLTDRQRTRHRLNALITEVPTLLSFAALAERTAQALGEAFRLQWASVYFKDTSGWIAGTYHLQPPFPTEPEVELLARTFEQSPGIWTYNQALCEVNMAPEAYQLVVKHQIEVVVPVQREKEVIGLLLLGAKRYRRSVFNVEDMEILKAFAYQMALALERLHLIERERKLTEETSKAQLVALRAQINPHFLFNALNTIAALVVDSPDQAEKAVEHLAGIFRHILQLDGRALVPLDSELTLVNHYLSIEQMRFNDRLRVSMDIPVALRKQLIPAFALQTLVENAVKHGIARKREGGTVHIRVWKKDQTLSIQVTDTGVGIPALWDKDSVQDPEDFFGIGLRNVKNRLSHLYGEQGQLLVESSPAGTTVTLTIPVTSGKEILSLANLV